MNKITIIQSRATNILHEGADKDFFGGAEMQSVQLAMLLNKKYRVLFITNKTDSSKKTDFNDLKVLYNYSKEKKGIKFVRFFYPRLLGNLRAMWKSNSCFYYQRGPGEITGMTAIYCKLFSRKFLYSVSGNGELKDLKKKIKNPFSRLLYQLGIFLSDTIICQTESQKKLLNPKFLSKAVVIKNIFPGQIVNNNKLSPEYIVNVGALRELKRQQYFLELAKYFPEMKFICIGGIGTSTHYTKELLKKSAEIDNLEMTGHLPHDRVNDYIKKSYCLVNCSDNEGFPNVFLEAWSNQIPVVSLGFDPDGIITKYSLGVAAKDIPEMKAAVKMYLENHSIRHKHGENGKNYVEHHHSGKKILQQYCNLLNHGF